MRDKVSLKYLAGLLDGEGCISMLIGRRDKPKPRIRIRLSLTNTHLGVCKIVHNNFGGKLKYRRRGSLATRNSYNVEWRSKAALELIRKIYPFLIVKREQAKVALKYPQGKAGIVLSTKAHKRRANIVNTLRYLNR